MTVASGAFSNRNHLHVNRTLLASVQSGFDFAPITLSRSPVDPPCGLASALSKQTSLEAGGVYAAHRALRLSLFNELLENFFERRFIRRPRTSDAQDSAQP